VNLAQDLTADNGRLHSFILTTHFPFTGDAICRYTFSPPKTPQNATVCSKTQWNGPVIKHCRRPVAPREFSAITVKMPEIATKTCYLICRFIAFSHLSLCTRCNTTSRLRNLRVRNSRHFSAAIPLPLCSAVVPACRVRHSLWIRRVTTSSTVRQRPGAQSH